DLGLSTGLRVMEIAALKCSDLFLEHSVPFLLVRKGKGGKRRVVYFNGQFKKHCGEYLMWKKNTGEPMGADDPLLRSDASGGHLTTRAIQKTFKRCAQTAGLSLAFSIHCLRHTYACFLLKASNWNIRLVQKQLGHARIATTQVYADVMLPDTQKAVGKLYQ
ncbi:MAG: tyrosine-type recombinase/integrase, partial [bacterium]|nr:tyrosine-type recombinase/integrase [bacterium]